MWIYLFYNLDDVLAQIFGKAIKKPQKNNKNKPSNQSQVLLFEQGGEKKRLITCMSEL